MSLNVTAGEEFTVKVGGDASGQLTNDGKYTLTASHCTADSSVSLDVVEPINDFQND